MTSRDQILELKQRIGTSVIGQEFVSDQLLIASFSTFFSPPQCELAMLDPVIHAAPVLETATSAADSDAEIAKKLNNPVASLISVPFQSNWDFRMGPLDEGTQFKLNFQPVIPVELNKD